MKEKEKMDRKVPFLDLRIINVSEMQDLLSAVEGVFRHGRIVLGPEVQELESTVAEYVGRKYAVGVNSGTDALFLGLKSLGIGTGDEVITTSLSWIATANAIALTGAIPVFADVGDDLNIDPKSVERLITPYTKAILPVHYTGKVCAMDELKAIADKHSLIIIEDASQSFGARYNNRLAGSFGDIACFSMNPMKVFAACGEAGIVLTDNKEIFDKLISLRYNGTVNKEICVEPGLNARLDTLQAAILLKRFLRLEQIISKRREISRRYSALLSDVVDVPREADNEQDVYYTYTIKAEKRDELKAYLENKGIETKIQHSILMPEQPAYRDGVRGGFFNAQRLVKHILCIPANEKLSIEDVDYVAGCIRDFYKCIH